MRDWIGNSKSIYSPHGASNHSDGDRATDDYYATDPSVIRDLFLVETFSDLILEPACGEGHLSKEIETYGKKVVSSDLIYRGYGAGGVDFLTLEDCWDGDIITNPPYKFAKEFVEKSLSLIYNSDVDSLKVAMFLKLTFLEGKKRRKLFDAYPPKVVYVYSSRKRCALNGDFSKTEGSAVAYAWFVWEKGIYADPIIRWI